MTFRSYLHRYVPVSGHQPHHTLERRVKALPFIWIILFAILARSPHLLSELTASSFLSRKSLLLGYTTSLCSNSDDTVLSCNEYIPTAGQATQSKTCQLNSNTDGRGSVSAHRSCFFLPWKPLSSMSGPFLSFLPSLEKESEPSAVPSFFHLLLNRVFC